MVIDDEQTEIVLNLGLEQQITNAIDPHFLLQLTTVLLGGFSPLNGLHSGQLDEKHVAAVSALCAFLHVTFNILPLERIMTVLAYRTELVAVLWNFMKQCHENQKWSSLSEQSAYLPAEALDGCYLWLFSARFTSKSLWLQHIQPVSSGGRFLQLSCMV